MSDNNDDDLNLMAWFVFVNAIKRFREEIALPRGSRDNNKIWWKLDSLALLNNERSYFVRETQRGPDLSLVSSV